MKTPTEAQEPAAETKPAAASPAPGAALEAGTYEVLQGRLEKAGGELRRRLEALNVSRQAIFGAIPTSLLATVRITTANNCVPRDMASLGGGRFLFGYNVFLGLKSETALGDVFAVYERQGNEFRPVPLDCLNDANFLADFRSLYRFYRDAFFASFNASGNYLYLVFQTSPKPEDIKSFKWELAGDQLIYHGNRFDHEVKFPPQHEFEWTRATRNMHRTGPHPHISILDRVFVETIGGDLTVKVEDNTRTGAGIYSEPVAHADQTLDDAEIFYAAVGALILLKIRPYQEKQFRYLAFNEKMREVRRIDAVDDACVLLPDDQGIVFSNGYYLQLGAFKEFPNLIKGMRFEHRRSAPNGEDHLFVFYNPADGDYILLVYNVIAQQVAVPIHCNGYCFFDNGELAFFQIDNTPQKHHAIQLWQTPFLGRNAPPPVQTDAYLFKVGNQAIVRAMAECHELLSLIGKDDSYVGLFVDIIKLAGDLLDSYFWLDHAEARNLREVILDIRATASAAVAEFEKVARIRQATAQATEAAVSKSRELIERLKTRKWTQINDFIEELTALRGVRGEIISLKELRYADQPRIEALNQEVAGYAGEISRQCVRFLLDPAALAPYLEEIRAQGAAIPGLAKAIAAKELGEAVEKTAQGLVLLTDTVNSLPSEDATETSRILEAISGVYAGVNQVKAQLRRRRQELQKAEGSQLFAAQVRLLDQSLASLLDSAATPALCDEYLNRLIAQFQEAEAKFSEAEEFLEQLAVKREAFCAAFAGRKSELVQARNARAESLRRTGERMLRGLAQRLQTQTSVSALEAFYASDPMVQRVHELVAQLTQLEDPVKAGDLQTQLQTARQEALHQLRDRLELYAEGDRVIRLGTHRFRVQTQELEATIVQRDGQLCFHLAGTGFYEPVVDPVIEQSRAVWGQEVLSENETVYRGEYLAYQQFLNWREHGELPAQLGGALEERLRRMQEFMLSRYAEGYAKGVHDYDAAQILGALLARCNQGLAGYPSPAKALAGLFWSVAGASQQRLTGELRGLQPLGPGGRAVARANYGPELEKAIVQWLVTNPLFGTALAKAAAAFLIEALAGDESPAGSREAREMVETFQGHLNQNGRTLAFKAAMEGLAGDPVGAFRVARQWLENCPESMALPEAAYYSSEASLRLSAAGNLTQLDFATDGPPNTVVIPGLRGSHARLPSGNYTFSGHEFFERLERFSQETAPQFQRYQARRVELCAQLRERLRLDGLKSQVLTSFVRNQLIDQCYLPLIGANLAKQIGAADAESRTDRMGLLLLISPPGYGKTTLMEYVANRLGLVFLKVNGPTLGNKVTSLDPAEAPNAAAREEIIKLNLGLEMGDNVMLYVDDIQHCHPEFLQKFISLCDGQRRIEGVWQGKPCAYDFRGKRVAVVMAGNPYTESGTRFQIPDMLANRADTYNLGEIIAGKADSFQLSYLENALTSCPGLAKLRRYPKDFLAIVRLVETHTPASGLEGSYTPEELGEFARITRILIQIRAILLRVNEEYIRSAAQADEHRTEPPFRLQGSYRNMNRLAERVVPVMNDEEVDALWWDHYQREAQTLASQAESSLLKLREIAGRLTPEQSQRWDHIKQSFRRNLLLRSADGQDPASRILAQLNLLTEGLGGIQQTLATGLAGRAPAGREEELKAIAGQIELLKAAVQASARPEAEPAGLATVAEKLAAAQTSLAACLSALNQQMTLRLIDPTQPSDYTVTNVDQATLRQIWELIDNQRKNKPA
jgi:hypothetical protein